MEEGGRDESKIRGSETSELKPVIHVKLTRQGRRSSHWVMSSRYFLEALECPSCGVYLSFPVNVCEKGHSICSICKAQKKKKCSVCRGKILDLKNLALQNVINMVRFPCRNYITGCKQEMLLKDLTHHEKMCVFRYYRIPYDSNSFN